ncbi:MAG TPA: alanine racemase [Jiangellaceae bacterium]|nr:alanine racemase [Jiangellaceae bacterium]
MALVLEVATERWRAHLTRVMAAPDHVRVIPVGKGNGYGLGLPRLAREASTHKAATFAVGLIEEISQVSPHFDGDILVMNASPDPLGALTATEIPEQVVHTVSRVADLEMLADSPARPRVVVELLTSMKRHGIALAELPRVAPLLGKVRFEGWSLHLPLGRGLLDEALTLSRAALSVPSGQARPQIWVSHLGTDQAASLAAATGADVQLRTGTELWLGDRTALRPRASVLDVHRVERGERIGYRQVRPGAGTALIVAGGTANGIGMVAPSAMSGMRSRAAAVARAGLEAAGRLRSPYRIGSRRLEFVEPPHMQASMVWLPSSTTPPAVGSELDLDVRFTTTGFDDIQFQ